MDWFLVWVWLTSYSRLGSVSIVSAVELVSDSWVWSVSVVETVVAGITGLMAMWFWVTGFWLDCVCCGYCGIRVF